MKTFWKFFLFNVVIVTVFLSFRPVVDFFNHHDVSFRHEYQIGKMEGVDVFYPIFSMEAKRRRYHNPDESVQPTIAGWDGFNNLSPEQKVFIFISGGAICVAILVGLFKPRRKREEDFSGELSNKFTAVPKGEGVVVTFSELIRSPEKFTDYPNITAKNGRVVYVFRTDDKAIALVAPDDFDNLNLLICSLSVVIFDAEDEIDIGDYVDEVEGVVRKGEVEGRKIFYFEVTDFAIRKRIPKEYRGLLEDVCHVAEIEFEE